MALSKIVAAAAAGLLGMITGTTAMQAAEITVLSTTAFKEALIELIPMFERLSGHKVNITYGGGRGLVDKIRAGATGDLFIGPAEFTDPLLKDGKLVAGSRVDFARSGSGVAVRAGAPQPDIGTPEKFKSALLAAKSVTYSSGASGIHFANVLERLGITAEINAKRVPQQPGELVGAVVARGASEIGVQQLSELMPVAGIVILGPLPGELQKMIAYGGSAFPASRQPEAAKALVNFLKSEAAAPIIRKKGMDPA